VVETQVSARHIDNVLLKRLEIRRFGEREKKAKRKEDASWPVIYSRGARKHCVGRG
jgi:hypothetical protein